MGGEWGEQASTYYIPTVSTVTFHNQTLGGKRFIAKAKGGRMALRMQLERDSSPRTCGLPSGGLGSRDLLNSRSRSASPGQGIETHSNHHLFPFISRVNIYK